MDHIPHVNILLSTFNGEKYLSEQLDSLLAQTYPNITIFIRDDGSSDTTVAILKAYQSVSPGKIVLLSDNFSNNLGYMQSFWILLSKSSDADYYAFCDQDDIWLPDKVALGVQTLEQMDKTLPLLYSSSFDYYDENLQFTGHAQALSSHIVLKDVLFYTPAFGFTILINQTLRKIALAASSLDFIPHDGWCQKIASSMGVFLYDSSITAKYRRHSSTVTHATSDKIKLIRKWLENDILGTGLSENYFVIRRLYEEYKDSMNASDQNLLETFMEQPVTFILYLKRLFFPKRLRPSLGGELALRLCFLFNK